MAELVQVCSPNCCCCRRRCLSLFSGMKIHLVALELKCACHRVCLLVHRRVQLNRRHMKSMTGMRTTTTTTTTATSRPESHKQQQRHLREAQQQQQLQPLLRDQPGVGHIKFQQIIIIIISSICIIQKANIYLGNARPLGAPPTLITCCESLTGVFVCFE